MKKTRITLISLNARMDESRHYKRRLTLNILDFFPSFFLSFFAFMYMCGILSCFNQKSMNNITLLTMITISKYLS